MHRNLLSHCFHQYMLCTSIFLNTVQNMCDQMIPKGTAPCRSRGSGVYQKPRPWLSGLTLKNHTSRQYQSTGRCQMLFLKYLQMISYADTWKAGSSLGSEGMSWAHMVFAQWMEKCRQFIVFLIVLVVTVSCIRGKTQNQTERDPQTIWTCTGIATGPQNRP